ncbi:MAG: inorganic phosphate transporter [Verrucomicrobia bacterium]|nr:inorganic phosphate transporter [Verrucomicrobiota bacterium]
MGSLFRINDRMEIGGDYLGGSVLIFAVIAVALAIFFEFINCFHDTANAVATVIYTHSLPANAAVIWSGLFNFLGVLLSTGAVAYGIVALLPPGLVLNVASGTGAAALFALLLAAVLWNFSTWYLGLPCSSSHSLIGSILGVSLVDSWMHPGQGQGIPWNQVRDVMMSLLVSPVLGFVMAAVLLVGLRLFVKSPRLFEPADAHRSPPWWVRIVLILTCTGVSFAHGSNDGQKGMGLFMLVLIVALPSALALNPALKPDDLQRLTAELDRGIHYVQGKVQGKPPLPQNQAREVLTRYSAPRGAFDQNVFSALAAEMENLRAKLDGKTSVDQVAPADRQEQRRSAYLIEQSLQKLVKEHQIESADLKGLQTELKKAIEYIPVYIKAVVAFALGLGTMIGWKRIVVTVAERIGKTHLAYAQGASAELTTAATILMADHLGLPVSTTHVLSSGIAGTMAANHSGLQKKTLRNIILAWVLTLPVCLFLGAMLFAGLLGLFFNVLGWK